MTKDVSGYAFGHLRFSNGSSQCLLDGSILDKIAVTSSFDRMVGKRRGVFARTASTLSSIRSTFVYRTGETRGHPYSYCGFSNILVDIQDVRFISIRFAIAGGTYG